MKGFWNGSNQKKTAPLVVILWPTEGADVPGDALRKTLLRSKPAHLDDFLLNLRHRDFHDLFCDAAPNVLLRHLNHLPSNLNDLRRGDIDGILPRSVSEFDGEASAASPLDDFGHWDYLNLFLDAFRDLFLGTHLVQVFGLLLFLQNGHTHHLFDSAMLSAPLLEDGVHNFCSFVRSLWDRHHDDLFPNSRRNPLLRNHLEGHAGGLALGVAGGKLYKVSVVVTLILESCCSSTLPRWLMGWDPCPSARRCRRGSQGVPLPLSQHTPSRTRPADRPAAPRRRWSARLHVDGPRHSLPRATIAAKIITVLTSLLFWN